MFMIPRASSGPFRPLLSLSASALTLVQAHFPTNNTVLRTFKSLDAPPCLSKNI